MTTKIMTEIISVGPKVYTASELSPSLLRKRATRIQEKSSGIMIQDDPNIMMGLSSSIISKDRSNAVSSEYILMICLPGQDPNMISLSKEQFSQLSNAVKTWNRKTIYTLEVPPHSDRKPDTFQVVHFHGFDTILCVVPYSQPKPEGAEEDITAMLKHIGWNIELHVNEVFPSLNAAYYGWQKVNSKDPDKYPPLRTLVDIYHPDFGEGVGVFVPLSDVNPRLHITNGAFLFKDKTQIYERTLEGTQRKERVDILKDRTEYVEFSAMPTHYRVRKQEQKCEG